MSISTAGVRTVDMVNFTPLRISLFSSTLLYAADRPAETSTSSIPLTYRLSVSCFIGRRKSLTVTPIIIPIKVSITLFITKTYGLLSNECVNAILRNTTQEKNEALRLFRTTVVYITGIITALAEIYTIIGIVTLISRNNSRKSSPYPAPISVPTER